MNPYTPPPPQAHNPKAKSDLLRVIKWLWWASLVFIFACALALGNLGNMALFWFLLVIGLPTIWLNKDWSKRAKLSMSAAFFAVFIGFGIYSNTPAGKAAKIASDRDTATREQADAKEALLEQKRQEKEEAQQQAQESSQEAQDAKQQAQQKADDDAKEEQAKQDSTDTKIGVYINAEQVITGRMKSPSSAVYPDFQDKFVQRTGDNEYRVTAYVDSQNSFGAMLRADWTLVIREDGDEKFGVRDVVIREQ